MPRITISINAPDEALDGELLTLELPSDITVKDLKGFVQGETNFEPGKQQFYFNAAPLVAEDKTLTEIGIKDGDMLAMLIRKPARAAPAQRSQNQQFAGARSGPGGPDYSDEAIEMVRLQTLGNQSAVQHVRQRRPELASALNDPAQFREVFIRMKREEEQMANEREQQMRLLNEDPFNVEAQQKIEELIRQDNVIQNLQDAYEQNPEVFARVNMLYINTEVNGHPVKAFVDSGAQATIMSPSCAADCGILRLIDRRFAGVAKGVGTANILGRVHHAEIKIGGAVMPTSFTVMEGKDVDLLFGLDMLKRYKACIDLDANVLRFQGIEVPFLPEAEIPKRLEEAQLQEPTISGPNGTEIGAQSGAVRPAGAVASGSNQQAVGGLPNGTTPAPASQPRATSQAKPAASATSNADREKIEQLKGLGFSEQESAEALRACDGNVEYAAGLLFQRQ